MTTQHFAPFVTSIVAAAFAVVLTSSPVSAESLECGDVNGNGMVSVGDALQVLNRAVGLPAVLECPCGIECPTTTSTTTTTSSTTTTVPCVGFAGSCQLGGLPCCNPLTCYNTETGATGFQCIFLP